MRGLVRGELIGEEIVEDGAGRGGIGRSAENAIMARGRVSRAGRCAESDGIFVDGADPTQNEKTFALLRRMSADNFVRQLGAW